MDYFNDFFPDLLKFFFSFVFNYSSLLTGGVVIALLFLFGILFKPIARKIWIWVAAFLLFFAFFNSWREERKKASVAEKNIQTLQSQFDSLTKPDFYGEITMVSSGPAGEKRENCIVTVVATITNKGAPSIVKIKELRITGKEMASPIFGMLLDLPKPLRLYEGEALKGPDYLELPDSIVKAAGSKPIEHNGAVKGYVTALITGLSLEQLNKEGVITRLSFADINDKQYDADFAMGKHTPLLNFNTLQDHKGKE